MNVYTSPTRERGTTIKIVSFVNDPESGRVTTSAAARRGDSLACASGLYWKGGDK